MDKVILSHQVGGRVFARIHDGKGDVAGNLSWELCVRDIESVESCRTWHRPSEVHDPDAIVPNISGFPEMARGREGYPVPVATSATQASSRRAGT